MRRGEARGEARRGVARCGAARRRRIGAAQTRRAGCARPARIGAAQTRRASAAGMKQAESYARARRAPA
jgi:hypothetical protein